MNSPFRTIKEVVAWSRASKTSVYRAIKTGALPARKHCGKIVVHTIDMEAWSASGTIQPETPSLSAFRRARERVRSLKTRHTDERPHSEKGVG